jgi:glutathione S-transferase
MTIFHIAHRADWDAALAAGEYRVSTRGLTLDQVGFIHASSADQLSGVAGQFYRDDPEALVVLEIDDAALGDAVRWEDAGEGELFPHIFRALHPTDVTAIVPAEFDESGRFIVEN